MKKWNILVAFFGLLLTLSLNNVLAKDIDCNKSCKNNSLACGYDEERDCFRPFFSACDLKKAVCKDGWKYTQENFFFCTAAFDFCAESYAIYD